jgi:hypothetical protein
MSTDTESGLGKEILSYCGKCKTPTAHIVVSLNKKGKVDKCECQTCKAVHKYRDPEKSPPQRASTKKAPAKRGASVGELWKEAISKAVGSAKPYAMHADFNEGDLIEHSTFGRGVVQELVGQNKMKVIFEEAEKLLVCNL